MPRVILLHWKDAELGARAERLRRAGVDVVARSAVGRATDFLRALREEPPDAVVIDLSRLPSHGCEVGTAIRAQARTRRLPLVFVGGAAEKVERVRSVLPDAVFTVWDDIWADLDRAIANPPDSPVRRASVMDAYAGRPLAAKLGIREGFRVAAPGAPPDFESILAPLPSGVSLDSRIGDDCHLVVWFVRSQAELQRKIAGMAARPGPLWIVWPKKSSGATTDLTQQRVRDAGLAAGLVDYKVCRIDETWAGLLFRPRRRPR